MTHTIHGVEYPPGFIFGTEIDDFINEMDNLLNSYPHIMLHMRSLHEGNKLKRAKTFEKYGSVIDEEILSRFSHDEIKIYQQMKENNYTYSGTNDVPKYLFIAMLSFYEGLIANLFKFIHINSHQLTNSPDLITNKGGLDKFVSKMTRGGRDREIKWIENNLNLNGLRGRIKYWPYLIEAAERRNRLVHSGGRINQIYLAKCEKVNYAVNDDVSIGDFLDIPDDYYSDSYEHLVGVGVLICCSVLKELEPESFNHYVANNLADYCVTLINGQRYSLTITLLSFIITYFEQDIDSATKATLRINLAQSYKWKGMKSKCFELVKVSDWTIHSKEHQLCAAVLSENFSKAVEISKLLGKDFKSSRYSMWPVFKEYIERTDFRQCFKTIYGKEFLD